MMDMHSRNQALYDSLSNRLNIEKRKMRHYIPEKRENKKLNNFIYSEKEDKLICEEGFSSIGKSKYSDGYLYLREGKIV